MPKWKKDATEFKVGVNYSEGRGAQSSIPKPVYDALGHPHSIKFVLKNNHVEIKATGDELHGNISTSSKRIIERS